jgi:hypothetical protein
VAGLTGWRPPCPFRCVLDGRTRHSSRSRARSPGRRGHAPAPRRARAGRVASRRSVPSDGTRASRRRGALRSGRGGPPAWPRVRAAGGRRGAVVPRRRAAWSRLRRPSRATLVRPTPYRPGGSRSRTRRDRSGRTSAHAPADNGGSGHETAISAAEAALLPTSRMHRRRRSVHRMVRGEPYELPVVRRVFVQGRVRTRTNGTGSPTRSSCGRKRTRTYRSGNRPVAPRVLWHRCAARAAGCVPKTPRWSAAFHRHFAGAVRSRPARSARRECRRCSTSTRSAGVACRRCG